MVDKEVIINGLNLYDICGDREGINEPFMEICIGRAYIYATDAIVLVKIPKSLMQGCEYHFEMYDSNKHPKVESLFKNHLPLDFSPITHDELKEAFDKAEIKMITKKVGCLECNGKGWKEHECSECKDVHEYTCPICKGAKEIEDINAPKEINPLSLVIFRDVKFSYVYFQKLLKIIEAFGGRWEVGYKTCISPVFFKNLDNGVIAVIMPRRA